MRNYIVGKKFVPIFVIISLIAFVANIMWAYSPFPLLTVHGLTGNANNINLIQVRNILASKGIPSFGFTESTTIPKNRILWE